MENIEHVVYINLDSRTDRRQRIELELVRMGLAGKSRRFAAIYDAHGAVGCTRSHIACIEMAQMEGWPHVLVLEDDVAVLNPAQLQASATRFFASCAKWDVLMLAGNVIPPMDPVCAQYARVSWCQTTTAYLVKSEYYSTLLTNFRTGLSLFIQNPTKAEQLAIDKFWIRLQRRDLWFILTPLSVVQAPGYSDIERRRTDYTRVMVDTRKAWLDGTPINPGFLPPTNNT